MASTIRLMTFEDDHSQVDVMELDSLEASPQLSPPQDQSNNTGNMNSRSDEREVMITLPPSPPLIPKISIKPRFRPHREGGPDYIWLTRAQIASIGGEASSLFADIHQRCKTDLRMAFFVLGLYKAMKYNAEGYGRVFSFQEMLERQMEKLDWERDDILIEAWLEWVSKETEGMIRNIVGRVVEWFADRVEKWEKRMSSAGNKPAQTVEDEGANGQELEIETATRPILWEDKRKWT